MTQTAMRLFGFDQAEARAHYEEHGWFHARSGVTDELMMTITAQLSSLMGADSQDLASWRYPKKKKQFLWELPDGVDAGELCRAVAGATGLDPNSTVISERHLKVYSESAPETPPPHKDRSASAVTVGIGLDSPPDSRLVLWPQTVNTYNPFPTAADWRNSRHPHELPEVVTAGEPSIEIDLRKGDIVMFRGANFYHERYRPASTSVLYLKFNDCGLDPLGEDPRTVEAEARSAELHRSGLRPTSAVRVSPKLIGIVSEEFFPDFGTVHKARTFESEHGIRLEPSEVEALRALAGQPVTTVADVGVEEGVLARLVELGLVLLS